LRLFDACCRPKNSAPARSENRAGAVREVDRVFKFDQPRRQRSVPIRLHIFRGQLERRRGLLVSKRATPHTTLGENDMRLSKLAAGGILGAGFLAASVMSASAAIVCSGNVCWHTHETYTYPPESRVVVHEDNWRWGPQENFSFREHEGRGYWRDDKWTEW
jgi:hypothetical protein